MSLGNRSGEGCGFPVFFSRKTAKGAKEKLLGGFAPLRPGVRFFGSGAPGTPGATHNCIGGAGGLFFRKATGADRLTIPPPGVMAKRDKTYYKITFTNETELYQVCARRVVSSELYGLIEIGDFIFPRNKLVFNPGEERIRREFEGILRTWLPYHAIVRIDEVSDQREGEIKIVPLDSFRKAPPQEPFLKKPEG